MDFLENQKIISNDVIHNISIIKSVNQIFEQDPILFSVRFQFSIYVNLHIVLEELPLIDCFQYIEKENQLVEIDEIPFEDLFDFQKDAKCFSFLSGEEYVIDNLINDYMKKFTDYFSGRKK